MTDSELQTHLEDLLAQSDDLRDQHSSDQERIHNLENELYRYSTVLLLMLITWSLQEQYASLQGKVEKLESEKGVKKVCFCS